MIILIMSFFVIAPLIILYTAGYRYDFSKQKIEQTGVLSIDAKPRDVTVYLNGVHIKKTMPIRLPNRAPGTYTLLMKKNGYQNWTKDVTIKSQKTTYIKKITLFKSSLPILIQKFPNKDIINAIVSPDGTYVLMTHAQQQIFSVTLLDTRTNTKTTIERENSTKPPRVSWSPSGDIAIIETTNATGDHVILIHANTPNNTIPYNYDAGQLKPAFEWTQDNTLPHLYVQIGKTIHELYESTDTVVATIPKNIPWYVDPDNVVWTTSNDGQTVFRLNDHTDVITPSLSDGESITNIISINKQRAILRTQNHTLVVHMNIPPKQQTTQTLNTQNEIHNTTSGEWETWSGLELWSLYSNGGIALLNRTNQHIRDVLPLDMYGVLLLVQNHALVAFNPGYYVTHILFNNGTIQSAGVDMKQRIIIFWGSIGNQEGLYQLTY